MELLLRADEEEVGSEQAAVRARGIEYADWSDTSPGFWDELIGRPSSKTTLYPCSAKRVIVPRSASWSKFPVAPPVLGLGATWASLFPRLPAIFSRALDRGTDLRLNLNSSSSRPPDPALQWFITIVHRAAEGHCFESISTSSIRFLFFFLGRIRHFFRASACLFIDCIFSAIGARHKYCTTALKNVNIMADNLPPSSPVRRSATTSATSTSNPNLLSPPRRPVSRGKERRNPSITPRKFQRFFTPRSRISAQPTAARKALCDLTAPALNRYQTPSSPLKPISEELQDGNEHRGKRRKFNHQMMATPEKQTATAAYLPPSPLQSSPLLPTPDLQPGWSSSPIRSLQSRRAALQDGSGGGVYRDEDVSDDEMEEDVVDEELVEAPMPLPAPVPLHRRGLGAQLVQRMTGAMRFASERALECPVAGKYPSCSSICLS